MSNKDDFTVKLYVRSLAPRGSQEVQSVLVEKLADLIEQDVLADYEIRVWGDAVPTDTQHDLANQVDAFEEWAETAGATLVGVEERPAGTLVDESRSIRTVPSIALAEYRGGELVSVAPHESDGAVHTVEDRLGALDVPTDDRETPLSVASD